MIQANLLMKIKSIKFLFLIINLSILLSGCDRNQTQGFTEINDARIFYKLSGNGTPIILIHGFTFDSRCWDYQIPALGKKYQVICYDLRGFGQSSLPVLDQPYSHTQDLISLMDYLGIDKAVLLGHSYGGRIALECVLINPERVIGLILPEAAMDADDIDLGNDFDELWNWLSSTREAVENEGIDKAKEVWINGSPLLPAIQNENSAALVKQMVNEYSGWHWVNKSPHVGFDSYNVAELKTITVPTLIMYGGISPIGYLRIAELQHENIPNSKLVKISNAAHALNIESSIQFNNEILMFLKENSIK